MEFFDSTTVIDHDDNDPQKTCMMDGDKYWLSTEIVSHHQQSISSNESVIEFIVKKNPLNFHAEKHRWAIWWTNYH